MSLGEAWMRLSIDVGVLGVSRWLCARKEIWCCLSMSQLQEDVEWASYKSFFVICIVLTSVWKMVVGVWVEGGCGRVGGAS